MFLDVNIRRLTEIVRVLARYEFFHIISELNLIRYLPLHQRFKSDKLPDVNPVLLRKVFEDLGGAFVKLGQLLAMRPDLIGREYCLELEKLLLNAEPMPYSDVKSVLSGIEGITDISKIPLGSASIAQVHKAKYKGHEVAIKVKRLGVDKKFQDDIAIMEYLAKQISKRYDIGFIDLNDIVAEFKRYTLRELDLKHEVKNIEKFGKNFEKDKVVKIPTVYSEVSNSGVIVMEYISGKNILEIPRKKSLNLVHKISGAVYQMIFEDRFFHADLHPGNIFYLNDKVVFLDFGIVARIDKEFEGKLFSLFSSLVNADLEGTTDALIDMHVGEREVLEDVLRNGLADVLSDFYDVSVAEMNFGEIFYGVIEVARRSRIKLPAQLVLFGKSMVTLEGFCKKVDTGFNIVADAKPYVKKVVKKRSSPGNMLASGKDVSAKMYMDFMRFPKLAKGFNRKFAAMENEIVSIDDRLEKVAENGRYTSRMITSSVIFMTLFFAALYMIDLEPLLFGYSMFSVVCFGLSMVFLFKILYELFRD